MKAKNVFLIFLSLLFVVPVVAQEEGSNDSVWCDDTLFSDTVVIDSIPQTLPWPQSVQVRLGQLVQSKLSETTQIGLMVWDLTADSALFQHQERQRMRPASTQKTVTAIAALDRLGGGYEFKTGLYYTGELADSTHTLRGDLYCVGGMDPLFDKDDMRALATAVKGLGIDTIVGRICEDRSFKDRDKWGAGWCWDDDNPMLSPLLVDRKDMFASTLMVCLREAGIVLFTSVSEAILPQNARLITQRTHSIDTVLYPMMKKSDNLFAESVFYQLAHAEGGRGTSAKAARSYIDRLVTRSGTDQKLIHVADGSGLSLYNYVTPEMEVMLLRYAYHDKAIYGHLLPSLPIAGVDGTLKNRMKGTAAAGNVCAKTGTVEGVSSLTGYCTAPNGHRLCFSIINQGVPKAKVGRDFQNSVCVALCSN
ncbi:MAG: D-alanyl-D-alanine carboxypeptidase/D-alanyl-D-alanine-endopeptidase [Prevotella sp.]|nr:D-alanyl-D-alanine carboxypeptidase/D-alanyl-D-alanine-endopeptidase [Prevotella sp.]